MAAPTLFRKAALERLSTPEQLDQVIRVTDAKSWLGVLVLAMIVTLAGLWGWFGAIPKKVESQGVLIRPGGVQTVATSISGTLSELRVEAGSRIARGQVIAVIEQRVEPVSPKVREEITSPYTGRVLELLATPQATVGSGESLFVLEQESEGLEAIAYVPAAQGKRVRPKMTAQISPSTVKREEHGFIVGTTREVSEFPVSRETMLRMLGNELVVDGLLKTGPVIAVTVDLQTAPGTTTGLRWSSSKGPPLPLTSGTPCSIHFIIERKRPISLVIPKLREITGAY